MFVINTAVLLNKLSYDIENSFSDLLFVDVSSSLETPQVCRFSFVCALVLIFLQLCSAPEPLLTFCNTLATLITSTQTTTVQFLEMKQPDIFLPPLFGYLLGYPTIYCNSNFSSSITSSTNNLSMIPLSVFQAKLKISLPPLNSSDTLVSSFSTPTMLCNHMLITSWKKKMESIIETENDSWKKVWIEEKEVTLPHVML